MTAPVVVSSSDAGASALYRIASSLIAVLDFALLGNGWEKVFSGTDGAVYRSTTGERKFFKIVHNISNTYSHAQCSMYDTMSDFNTGSGLTAVRNFPLIYNSLANTVEVPWRVFVNPKAVIIITKAWPTYDNWYSCGFGETIPMLPGETARSFIAGAVSTLYGSNTAGFSLAHPAPYNINSTYGYNYGVNRSIGGTRTGLNCGVVCHNPAIGTTADGGSATLAGSEANTIMTYPYNGSLITDRPILDDGVAYGIGDYLPGLYYPCHKRSGFTNLQPIVDGDKTFLPVYAVNANAAVNSTASIYLGAFLLSLNSEDWPS